jgi:hypothetical protein
LALEAMSTEKESSDLMYLQSEVVLMRNDLIELIDKIDEIKSHFQVTSGNGMPRSNVIYNKPEFSLWKQELQLELQHLYDKTKDMFIHNILVNLKQGFNGWKDEHSFNELSGSLLAMRKNIDKYYPLENENIESFKGANDMNQKRTKIFISHSSKDQSYVSRIVDFLENIGLRSEQLFCSSVPGYNIPLNEDIFDYLKKQFQDFNLHVIFILSKNYYESVACMNEMGAAWVLQNKYTTVLLPGFDFHEIKGSINPRQIALKLDSDKIEIKEKLDQLKDVLINEFGLEPLQGVRWESKRDSFISSILESTHPSTIIGPDAQKLLQAACNADEGTIIMTKTLSGTDIQVENHNFITSQDRREIAKWENVVRELLVNEFIESRGKEGSILVVTQKGYDFIEEVQK